MADTLPGPAEAATVADRLDSWKEIAAYLRRGLATVQRWEKQEGLPVHRHHHGSLGSVYGYKTEIDAWWRERSARLAGQEHVAERASALSARGRLFAVAAGALALVAALAIGLVSSRRSRVAPPAGPAPKVMLAVLPFQDLSGDPQQDYFSDGLTEEMITTLALLHPERLGVIARTSVMRYKGADKGVGQIGEELGVQYVLEGSVRRSGNRVRVVAQLVEVRGQTHLWAQTYDRDVADAIDIQRDVAERIGASLALKLLAGQGRGRPRPASAGAYEDYLKGRYFWNKRNAAGFRKAIDYFQRAIEADPRYAQAWAGLADAYALAASADYAVLPPREAMPRARAAAMRARGARRRPRRAARLAGVGAPRLRLRLAGGRAGVQALPRAEPRLRHGAPVVRVLPGRHGAPRRGRLVDRAGPPDRPSLGGDQPGRRRHALHRGMPRPGRPAVPEDARDGPGLRGHPLVPGPGLGGAGTVRARERGVRPCARPRGQHRLSSRPRTCLRRLRPSGRPAAHANPAERDRFTRVRVALRPGADPPALGQKDQALSLLERAYEEREEAIPYLKVEGRFAPIRSEPRFAALVEHLGLPQ